MQRGLDHILQSLAMHGGLISDYISHFSESSDADNGNKFIDTWFISRANTFLKNPDLSDDIFTELEAIDFNAQPPPSRNVRLISVQPNYFRGFRKQDDPINLKGDLVVLDGRNSSGKTSLTEAIEWILTGHIVRRELGDPKELAECITNRFKPDEEETWVELIFEETGKLHNLRRTLVSDYSSKKNSSCESIALLDGQEISKESGSEVLNMLFSGVLPLLMQHTLRRFVLDTPQKRRDYFEQLLNLDQITYLIEKSVVSDSRLNDFPSKSGSIMLAEWNNLRDSVSEESSRRLRKVERSDIAEIRQSLHDALQHIAVSEFDLDKLALDAIVGQLAQLQRSVRQKNFPLLESLRPRRTLDEALSAELSETAHKRLLEEFSQAASQYKIAKTSAKTISQAQLAISDAFNSLSNAGLINLEEDQICPLCQYEQVPTLSTKRVSEISGWSPLVAALESSRANYKRSVENITTKIKELQTLRADLIPDFITDEQFDGIQKNNETVDSNKVKSVLEKAHIDLQTFDVLIETLLSDLTSMDIEEDASTRLEAELQTLFSQLHQVTECAGTYANAFKEFEDYISAISREDKHYRTRDLWLKIVENMETLLTDLKWESAKRKSQQELTQLREIMISARQTYLEGRRLDFSKGMSDLWNRLRSDRYSSFGKLYIPEPKGRGFPVKIEVKALLDNNAEQHEVDALGVFSESQINAIGIAAFITRSMLMGHHCLIFDDPVQSMDEEHFKTFAKDILSHLCDQGLQIIVLTHSDVFAREISYAHMDRPTYVTMNIKHSRRKGCRVEEGNRRFSERLDRAKAFADDGDLRQAWLFVRLAIERLYTVTQVKHGPSDFTPGSWANHTAEAMWNEGVDEIFKKYVPEMTDRLREILNMTAAGAHDKSLNGTTDLHNAVSDLRPLTSKLKVGG